MSIIKLDNISKSYGNNKILNNFSLEIEKGEFVAITGESGSGKSTLLNIIGLLECYDSGKYTICDVINPKPNSFASTRLLRKEISYLFRNYALISNQTVFDNLEVATRFMKLTSKQEKEIISDALADVGLMGVEKRKVGELSGGEQQRVALARIMIKPSDIILADEPTGSLDHHNRDRVMTILEQLNKKGKTIIVVSHDPDVVKQTQKNVTLSH